MSVSSQNQTDVKAADQNSGSPFSTADYEFTGITKGAPQDTVLNAGTKKGGSLTKTKQDDAKSESDKDNN
ncbi:hypothetical protein FRC02_005107 [Tulasnella sp. 418]|nr:hypothetical protein FRC02_005107 [Tulasnella sp. 418]